MEDSDMDNMGSLRPQTFLFGCELKGDKPYHFKVNDEENEHQLSLRTVSLGVGAKDELHVVEAEALDYEGNQIKVTLASLKMSVQPTVSLGGFEITPPVILRLKSGSGPVYVSGQHLVALEEEPESEDEDEDKVQQNMVKRPAGVTLAKVPLKKARMADKDFEDDDDDDDDDEEDDDEDEDEEEEEDKTPQKKPARDSSVKKTPKSKQNGKDSKLATPKLATSKLKTPESQKAPETPKSPRPAKSPKQFSIEEIKAKMQAIMEKGMNLPKLEAKFANYIKSCYKAEDPKVIQELWQWRQSL
ncbi:nucleophosmin [Ahaetulla prasina]|uniref:nucleophosmin n=1 Tax=Ahaetulla prasina TaxID=499056 RepID=UPI00264796F6|nr:nucleophosmin [Ahaetulla prasina]